MKTARRHVLAARMAPIGARSAGTGFQTRARQRAKGWMPDGYVRCARVGGHIEQQYIVFCMRMTTSRAALAVGTVVVYE